MNVEQPTSNSLPCHAIVGRLCHTPSPEAFVSTSQQRHGKSQSKNNQFTKRTFPIRFARKFGKLSADAKRGDSTQIHRDNDADSREISAHVRAQRFVPGRSLVWTLQRTQWRMVGQRAIHLRLVRPVFSGFGGRTGRSQFQISNFKFQTYQRL